MSYVHPGLTYFLSNYGPLFNLCDNCISAGDRLRDRRPETWIARRKSCSLARVKGVAAAPGCSRTPVFSNGPYRVTPHLTSPPCLYDPLHTFFYKKLVGQKFSEQL